MPRIAADQAPSRKLRKDVPMSQYHQDLVLVRRKRGLDPNSNGQEVKITVRTAIQLQPDG